jgi:hypothetical protein
MRLFEQHETFYSLKHYFKSYGCPCRDIQHKCVSDEYRKEIADVSKALHLCLKLINFRGKV